MSRRNESPARVALGSVGIGLAVGPLLLVPALARGGLAPVAVAGAVAVLIGAPAALAEWRGGSPAAPPARAAAQNVAELAGIGLVASAAAEVGRAGWAWLAVALLAWPLGALLGRSVAAIVAAAGAAVLVGATGAGIGAAAVGPWTLLQPYWGAAGDWLGDALLAGVWLGGAATGQFVVGPRRRPGENTAPWAVAGAGILLATALAVRAAAGFEVTHGVRGPDPWLLAATALGVLAAVGSLSRRTVLGSVSRAGIGAVVTAWLVATGSAGAAFVTGAVLPVLGALSLAAIAVRGSGRVAAGLGVAVLALGIVASGPDLPARAGEAAAIGALVVAGFWLVATRAVVRRGAA